MNVFPDEASGAGVKDGWSSLVCVFQSFGNDLVYNMRPADEKVLRWQTRFWTTAAVYLLRLSVVRLGKPLSQGFVCEW